ncbi:hypothetical protein pb186bvf_014095 [Paramecium bursaria]
MSYKLFGVPCDKYVVHQFVTIVVSMILLPLSTFFGLQYLFPEYVYIAGFGSILTVQIIIGIYIYMIVKDPNNFTKEIPRTKVKQG